MIQYEIGRKIFSKYSPLNKINRYEILTFIKQSVSSREHI